MGWFYFPALCKTRRNLIQFCMVGFVFPAVASHIAECSKLITQNMGTLKQVHSTAIGQLRARPNTPNQAGTSGLFPLGLGNDRDGLLYVPAGYQASQPAPLILMMHGAGGDAEGGLVILQNLADGIGAIVLAVDSRQQTWDVIIGRYGADIDFIDRALAETFNRYVIDPDHFAVAGFSDGASYALSIGIINGDLFSHIIAFSPGYMAPTDQVGEPLIFISHGQNDTVLPIDRCSRQIVPELQQAGYDVQYQEFNGPHTVPVTIVQDALAWFMTT